MPTQSLEDAIKAIADGTPVRWDALEREPDTTALGGLHILDDVARAFRRSDAKVAGYATRLFCWGPLEVEGVLGQGAYGKVYRAFDPWLACHVALKLYDLDAPMSRRCGQQLDEARRLARVRHRNVLCVYGCAVHDGVAGIWSELIEGRTLADAITVDGPLSTEEALRIGRDLARALAAVHAAGLVHGDVKASNAMRESGGRIVLMDFGTGDEQRLLASRRTIVATPSHLPPEVLAGDPLSARTDLYALGVLLFFLLTGRTPYEGASFDALQSAQQASKRFSLHNLVPDIDDRCAAFVERCLEVDPGARPQSAGELATELDSLLKGGPPAAACSSQAVPPRGAIASGIAVAVAVAFAFAFALALAVAWPHLFAPAWRVDSRFLRLSSGTVQALATDAQVSVGDKLRLRFSSNRPAWVYVLNEDAEGNATLLFPAENPPVAPVAAGEDVELPGGTDHPGRAWQVTSGSDREEFIVLATLEPQPDLDAALREWRAAAGVTRSVGGLTGDDDVPVLGTHLRAILEQVDRARARSWHYVFAHHR